MAEEKKRPPTSHYNDEGIVIEAPTGTPKEDIVKEIQKALAERPMDMFAGKKSKQLVIVVKDEGW
ncbi:MAG: hypothetical protein WDN23_07720 [Edaphobacter sp.]